MQETCTPQKKKECLKNAGAQLALVCAGCPGSDPHEPSDWFLHVDYLYRLHAGGYPFGKDDLSLEEWRAMGEYSDMMAVMKGVRLG